MGQTYHHQSVFGPGRRAPLCRETRAQWLAKIKLNRRPGRLTLGCVVMALELVKMLGHDGQLDPSNDTLAVRCGLSPSQTAECRKRLRDFGFLDWERRLVRVRDPDSISGWKTLQTSNAYRLLLPGACADTDFRFQVPNLCLRKRGRSGFMDFAAEQRIADANRDRQLRLLQGEAAASTGLQDGGRQ